MPTPWIELLPAGRRLDVPRWAIVLVVTWALAVALFIVIKQDTAAPPLCLFRAVTGVPCATCGSTRAALAVIDGRVFDAVRLNPFVCGLFAVGAGWLVLRLGFGRCVRLSGTARGVMWSVVSVCFALNWIWVVVSDRALH